MRYITALTLFLVAGSTTIVRAQGVGASVSGVVEDATGAPIPGATVVVKNVETGAVRRLISDDAGRYSTPSVPVGRYEIDASKDKFKSQSRTGIDLVVGE